MGAGRERTRDALRHKRTNGERVGNIQFGYRLCTDRRHVEPDPGEQALLTEVQNLRQSGQTLRGIAAALNHRALRTRHGSRLAAGARGANPEAARRSPVTPSSLIEHGPGTRPFWALSANRGKILPSRAQKRNRGPFLRPENGILGEFTLEHFSPEMRFRCYTNMPSIANTSYQHRIFWLYYLHVIAQTTTEFLHRQGVARPG